MTHIDLDTLVRLREPGREPGQAEAEKHLGECEACRREADRLEQRVARLKALSTLKPSRDAWPAVHVRLLAERRVGARRLATGGLAIAAGLALMLLLRGASASSK